MFVLLVSLNEIGISTMSSLIRDIGESECREIVLSNNGRIRDLEMKKKQKKTYKRFLLSTSSSVKSAVGGAERSGV